MRIADVEVVPIRVPLVRPLRMAIATVTHRDAVVVRIRDEDGTEGVGEAVLAPYFTGETVASARALLEGGVRTLLLGADPSATRVIAASLDQLAVHNRGMRSAVDIALHDLVARSLGVPLARLLGGRAGERRRTTWHLSGDDLAEDARDAVAARDLGYSLFKVKVGRASHDAEVELVRAVRVAIGPDADLVLDANQGWRAPEAVRFLAAVQDEGVLFLEQPLARADLHGSAWVQARTGVPIVADEGVSDAADLYAHLRLDAVRGTVAKVMKSGGVHQLVDLARLASVAGIETSFAGMPGETSIAAAAALHVAACFPASRFGTGICPQAAAADVVTEPLAVVDGALEVPSGPGLGVTICEDALDRRRID